MADTQNPVNPRMWPSQTEGVFSSERQATAGLLFAAEEHLGALAHLGAVLDQEVR